jgi:hypothetical protein
MPFVYDIDIVGSCNLFCPVELGGKIGFSAA